MASLFISTKRPPSEESVSVYQIEVSHYLQAMKENWPDANVYVPPAGTYPLRWGLTAGTERGILGGLQSDKRTVSFDGNLIESALQFIVWHRRYVPREVQLYLFDDNLLMIHDLTTTDNLEDLRAIIANKLSN